MERKNNNERFKKLRLKYPYFTYKSFSYKYKEQFLELSFSFICDMHSFSPKINIPLKGFYSNLNTRRENLDILVFNIGLIELISYWKAFASPFIIIECGGLSDAQIGFWKKIYFNGLGEYFYLNSIETNIKDFVNIISSKDEFGKCDLRFRKNRVILPIGGGKDSVVSMEIIKRGDFEIIPMIINPRGASLSSVERGGFDIDSIAIINREIDPYLLDLNALGYLNGHTPFSAMLAFYNLLISALTSCRHIALSNESSASESTVKGLDINHQYSKSLEFENDFREYTREFIHKDINYFSLLRPLSELQIAQEFAFHTRYHDVFRSCNVGSKTDIWCCNCPKCLFAYIILSPFLSPDKLSTMFSENLLDKDSLSNYLDELTGLCPSKPFECVGTIHEVNHALSLACDNFPQILSFNLVKHWMKSFSYKDILDDAYSSLLKIEEKHNLMPEFLSLISSPYSLLKLRELVLEIGNKDILILGYGREGRSTYRLLRKLFPNKLIGIQDKNIEIYNAEELQDDFETKNLKLHLGEDSLYAQNGYNLIIKSPGFNLRKMRTQYPKECISSQIDIFLKYFSPKVIGVTGTKGKSTSSTMIYTAIKQYTDNVLLGGNIGVPVFDLIPKINQDTYIVLELSAHQLEYINTSPFISIILNLFEEHLDFFPCFTSYQDAKLNILRYLNNGYFIYNSRDNILNNRLKEFGLSRDNNVNYHSIDIKDYVFQEPKYIKGEHNKGNILFALKVIEILFGDISKALNALIEFKGLANRLEYIGSIDGVEYYNDSISTIPQATLEAIKALKYVQTLILGGMDRGIDYSSLVELLENKELENIAYIGKAGKRIKEILEKEDSYKINHILTDDFSKAVLWCKEVTDKGKICLLSPSAPSYDMFKNFEERGSKFVELVLK